MSAAHRTLWTGLLALTLAVSLTSARCPERDFIGCVVRLRSQRVPFSRNLINVVFTINSEAKLLHTCRAYSSVMPCFRDRIVECGDDRQHRMLAEVRRLLMYMCSPFSVHVQRDFIRHGACIGRVLRQPATAECQLDSHPLCEQLDNCRAECERSKEFVCLMKTWVSQQSACTVVDVERQCGDEATKFYVQLQRAVFEEHFPIICQYPPPPDGSAVDEPLTTTAAGELPTTAHVSTTAATGIATTTDSPLVSEKQTVYPLYPKRAPEPPTTFMHWTPQSPDQKRDPFASFVNRWGPQTPPSPLTQVVSTTVPTNQVWRQFSGSPSISPTVSAWSPWVRSSIQTVVTPSSTPAGRAWSQFEEAGKKAASIPSLYHFRQPSSLSSTKLVWPTFTLPTVRPVEHVLDKFSLRPLSYWYKRFVSPNRTVPRKPSQTTNILPTSTPSTSSPWQPQSYTPRAAVNSGASVNTNMSTRRPVIRPITTTSSLSSDTPSSIQVPWNGWTSTVAPPTRPTAIAAEEPMRASWHYAPITEAMRQYTTPLKPSSVLRFATAAPDPHPTAEGNNPMKNPTSSSDIHWQQWQRRLPVVNVSQSSADTAPAGTAETTTAHVALTTSSVADHSRPMETTATTTWLPWYLRTSIERHPEG